MMSYKKLQSMLLCCALGGMFLGTSTAYGKLFGGGSTGPDKITVKNLGSKRIAVAIVPTTKGHINLYAGESVQKPKIVIINPGQTETLNNYPYSSRYDRDIWGTTDVMDEQDNAVATAINYGQRAVQRTGRSAGGVEWKKVGSSAKKFFWGGGDRGDFYSTAEEAENAWSEPRGEENIDPFAQGLGRKKSYR